MNTTLHISNPLLFAFLHIIDAAPFNVHLFAPRTSGNFSRTPSLLPPATHKQYPAFSYVVIESRKTAPEQQRDLRYKNRKLLTIEAAYWEPMPTQNNPDCDWYYTDLNKYTSPLPDNDKTGLNISYATFLNKFIEMETKLSAIIYALDAKPLPNQEGAFEETFGFKREGDLITKYFTDTSAAQLIGVVARFQLWVNDDIIAFCNRCGWAVDTAQLTTQALKDKLGVSSLSDCV